MAALTDTVTTSEMNLALDREFILNYMKEYDRLAEILGIFSPEVIQAGTALYQTKITGKLNDSKTDGSSSGTSYVEGDLVALSKYETKKTPMGSVDPAPYRKLTTAAAILKSGYEVAVMRTDAKMLSHARSAVVSKFFDFLKTGTGAATGAGLQELLANMTANLADAMEDNGDSAGSVVHFMNRQDAAAYLGKAPITTQTVFGMTYLESFLGVERVFLTNKVEKGTVIATPTDNIHVFGLDFSALASADLAYTQSSGGLIGVAHRPAYDRVSAETNVLTGTLLFPEVADYIVKGTISAAAEGAGGDVPTV